MTDNRTTELREKLEADIWAGCDHLTMAERGDVLVNVPLNRLYGWLDRQANITRREVKLRELYKFEENHRGHIDSIEEVNRQLNERIAELQECVDELEEENRLMRERLRNMADNDVTVFGMKLDEVRNLQAENARLREMLGGDAK